MKEINVKRVASVLLFSLEHVSLSFPLATKEVAVTLDNILNCRRVVHRAEVTQTVWVLLHHFPQHPPHYLPRARLRQTLHKLRND